MKYMMKLLIPALLALAMAGCGSGPSASYIYEETAAYGAEDVAQETVIEDPEVVDLATSDFDASAPEETVGITRPTHNHGTIRNITATEFVQGIHIGWNLGNTLDAYAHWGLHTNAEIAWINRLTTREMIDTIADAGFNILRLPVTWTTGMGHFARVGPGPEYTIQPWFLNRVEEIANWALDNDMYVIINAHHDAWKYRVGPESLAQDQDMIVSLWTQIAQHFADYCDRVIFLTMNEPQGERHHWLGTDQHREYVNIYNQLIVDTIRATGGNNETRFVMAPTLSAGGAYEHFRDFRLPTDMFPDRLIASVHSYAPSDFTFGPVDTHAEFGEAERGHVDWFWHTVDERFLQQGIPVIVGEFGSQNKNNEAARAEHARHFVAGGRALGVPSIWWDNYLFESENPYHERFGLFDRGTLEFRFPLILEGMMESIVP